ncbi:hypothetical protein C900_01845 [Fulvivirga imtechensis AK7]|uniref:Uncharacterized protein n=1 Tax=Fulvivirga imtechensis AK7 TaxID=1237149 RepID=L8JV69_9BACT|nr:hypothetical protein C900_01845 [Fulvivirga imtechensis AK7]
MHRSEMSETTHECWLKIPDHFPFTTLGSHIVGCRPLYLTTTNTVVSAF